MVSTSSPSRARSAAADSWAARGARRAAGHASPSRRRAPSRLVRRAAAWASVGGDRRPSHRPPARSACCPRGRSRPPQREPRGGRRRPPAQRRERHGPELPSTRPGERRREGHRRQVSRISPSISAVSKSGPPRPPGRGSQAHHEGGAAWAESWSAMAWLGLVPVKGAGSPPWAPDCSSWLWSRVLMMMAYMVMAYMVGSLSMSDSIVSRADMMSSRIDRNLALTSINK